MAKKKLQITIFEIVWYILCAVVCAWGLTYSVLGLVAKYADIGIFEKFDDKIKELFGLNLYFWGLIIMALAASASVLVLLIYGKKFDRVSEREQRRSARLGALKKESAVVDVQPAIVVAPVEESKTPKVTVVEVTPTTDNQVAEDQKAE